VSLERVQAAASAARQGDEARTVADAAVDALAF
jgi:hypothetical protein